TAYRIDIDQFQAYLKSQYELDQPENATFLMIRSWIVSLVETGLDKTSVNRKIATLRSFFGFLLRRKSIAADPMLKVTALKTSKKIPVFVEEKPMETLLDDVDFPDDFKGVRDKLV